MNNVIERTARAWLDDGGELPPEQFESAINTRMRALLDGAPAESEADRAALNAAKCPTCGGLEAVQVADSEAAHGTRYEPCPDCAAGGKAG